jgi:hypothetical protein
MSKSFLKNIEKMCSAFFYGCKVKVLKPFDIDKVDRIEKRNVFDDPSKGSSFQYDASKILNWMFRVYMAANPKSICVIGVTT